MSSRPERRREILDGAFRALMHEGLPHLSYDRVAREAGLSRQLVRYHFPDPEDLAVALADHLALAYRSVLLDGMTEIAANRRLDFFLDFYFDLARERRKPRDDRAYNALTALAAGAPKLRSRLRDIDTQLGQLVANEIQIQHPGIGPARAAELSYVFVALMYGHWRMVATLGLDAGHARIARTAMERLIRDADHASGEDPPTVAWRTADG